MTRARYALLALLALPLAAGCGGPLHDAAKRDDAEAIRRLVAAGEPVDRWNQAADKWTPLHYAAVRGNDEAVKALIEAGASLSHRSSGGTARQIAERFNQPETAALIKRYEEARAARLQARAPAAAIPAPAAAATTPMLVSDVDRPARRAPERPDDFALIVGIDEYQSLPRADHGVRDAQAVRRHLEALGVPPRNIVSLEGSAATGTKLRSYLEEWLPLNVKPQSQLFVYYSGHGAPEPKTGEAYLVPWDGDPKFLKSSAYPLRTLYAELAKTKAKRVIVALDACFSGAGGRSVLAKGARPLVTRIEEGAPVDSRLTVLAAASGDEITGSLDEQGHGIFTYHLLKGLSGDAKDAQGAVSPRSLYEYLKPRVQDDARRQNRDQTPALFGGGLDHPLANW